MLSVNRTLHLLGTNVGAHPRTVLAAWALAIALGVWGAQKFDDAAQAGTTGLYGSPSYAVTQALHTEFSNPFVEPLVVAASSPRLTLDDPAFFDWNRDAAAALRGLAVVAQVSAYSDFRDPRLRTPDGHQAVLLVGLNANDVPGQQRAVPLVRAALAPLRSRLTALDASAQVAVTGGAGRRL